MESQGSFQPELLGFSKQSNSPLAPMQSHSWNPDIGMSSPGFFWTEFRGQKLGRVLGPQGQVWWDGDRLETNPNSQVSVSVCV